MLWISLCSAKRGDLARNVAFVRVGQMSVWSTSSGVVARRPKSYGRGHIHVLNSADLDFVSTVGCRCCGRLFRGHLSGQQNVARPYLLANRAYSRRRPTLTQIYGSVS